jgi:hypothetical protein
MYYEESEIMDSNMEIKSFRTHAHITISSSKCEECVLKFVPHPFCYTLYINFFPFNYYDLGTREFNAAFTRYLQ